MLHGDTWHAFFFCAFLSYHMLTTVPKNSNLLVIGALSLLLTFSNTQDGWGWPPHPYRQSDDSWHEVRWAVYLRYIDTLYSRMQK